MKKIIISIFALACVSVPLAQANDWKSQRGYVQSALEASERDELSLQDRNGLLDHPLYSWIEGSGGSWRQQVAPGEVKPRDVIYRGERGKPICGLGGYQMFDSLAVEASGNVCVATLISGCISVIAPDGKLVAETEQALVPEKATVSTFSIGNAQPWPSGAYTLDISLNGLVQRTVSFEVK